MRAAAKNFRDVVVVVDPGDYPEALEALRRSGGPGPDFRLALARKAFAHTASYDGAIASTLSAVEVADGRFTRAAAPAEELVPDTLEVRAERRRTLRYGENPHQAAALYAAGEAGFGGARVVQGKPLSFTNLLDLDAAARLAREFDEPAAVVVKHTNPCGGGDRRRVERRLRVGAGGRCPVRVRRDRGVEPRRRPHDGGGDSLHLHRGGGGAGRRRRGPRGPRGEEEPPAGPRGLLVGRRCPIGSRRPVHSRRDPRAGRRPRDGGGGTVDRGGGGAAGVRPSGAGPGGSRPRRSGRPSGWPGGSRPT